MATKNVLLPIPLTSVAGSAFTGSYQAINSSGLPQGVCILRIINNSSSDVLISYDGSTNHDFVTKSGGVLTINAQTNAQPNTSIANFRAGTIVYLNGTALSTGNLYLAAYYQPQA
jgi:hypothetical protein